MADRSDATTADRTRNFGIVLLFVGAVLLFWPAATARVLAVLVGLGALAYGTSELARIYRGHGDHLEISAGMIGLVSVFGGIVIAITPFVSESATSTVIGLYWLLAGVVEVAGALLRPVARSERLLVGVLSAAMGALVLVLPPASIVVLVWFAGGWMLAVGAIVVLMRSITTPRRAVA